MTIPTPIKLPSDPATLSQRAWRVVDRLLPRLPDAHGFRNPHGFILASQRDGFRSQFFWLTKAQLRAKATGEEPYVALPADGVVSGGMEWAHWQLIANTETAWSDFARFARRLVAHRQDNEQ